MHHVCQRSCTLYVKFGAELEFCGRHPGKETLQIKLTTPAKSPLLGTPSRTSDTQGDELYLFHSEPGVPYRPPPARQCAGASPSPSLRRRGGETALPASVPPPQQFLPDGDAGRARVWTRDMRERTRTQTDRQADTHRQTDRHTDRQTDRQTDTGRHSSFFRYCAAPHPGRQQGW
eukprot:gene8048-biopygen13634